jgi:uncharacterized protein
VAGGDILVVMARQPVPGRVKTRLARAVGDVAACDLYRAFLRDLRARLEGGAWRTVWAVQPAGCDLSGEIGAPVECLDQRGDGLGERMGNAFADLFGGCGAAGRVVMIGADLPHLPLASIASAFAALEESDVVLVPTRDGGYGLVGLRRALDLFSGIEMSTPEVCAQTLARAASLGSKAALLAETFDVDELADLRDLAAAMARGEVSLPFTAAVLRRHHL